MTTQKIRIGENMLIDISLYRSDNTTPLLVAELTFASVELWQGSTQKATYQLNVHNNLRQGDNPNDLRLELTRAVSATMSLGELKLRYILEVADARFTVDSGTQRDVVPCYKYEMVSC